MIDPSDIYEKLILAGNEYADKNATAELLEETKKTCLAELGNQSGESTSVAKETAALRHPAYKDHVTKMVEARRKALIAKVDYEARKAWIDLVRTQAATERIANKHAT